MPNVTHNVVRLETARDQLIHAAELLQSVIDGQVSQSKAGSELDMTPQDMNRNLQMQFQPYIKKNINQIDKMDLCQALERFRTPADRFMLEIFEDMLSQDPDVIDVLPEYDEAKFWEIAGDVLNAVQLDVMEMLTGRKTGEPMPVKTVASELDVSEVYIRGVRKRAVFKMRRTNVIERIIPDKAFHLIELSQQIMQETARIVNDYQSAKTAYETAHPMELATQAFLEDRIPDENIRNRLGLILTSDVETAAKMIPVIIPIQNAGLSERAKNCLRRANVDTLNQLAEMSLLDIKKIRNAGKKTREEFYHAMKKKLGIDRPELLDE